MSSPIKVHHNPVDPDKPFAAIARGESGQMYLFALSTDDLEQLTQDAITAFGHHELHQLALESPALRFEPGGYTGGGVNTNPPQR